MASKIKPVDEIQQKFTDKFNYFSRYKNDRRFGLAWWYAFARAALLFFTILGYLLEGVNVANHYAEFVKIVSFFGAVIAPISISLASLIVFSLIVGGIAYHKFKEDFKKCIDSYKVTQKEFLASVKNRIIIEQVFLKKQRTLPYNYYNPVDHTELKLPEEGMIKKLILLVHGAVAAVGWLQALSVFTGLHVFSMTAVAGGFVPPVIFSLLFIILVAAVVTYIEGVVEVSQKYHRKMQHRLQIQFTSQFNLVMASLGQNTDSPAQIPEKDEQALAIESDILYKIIHDEQRFDQDGCVIFSAEEMGYALAYIDISRENIGSKSSASVGPAAFQVNPVPLTARVSCSPSPRFPDSAQLRPTTHRSFVSHPNFGSTDRYTFSLPGHTKERDKPPSQRAR